MKTEQFNQLQGICTIHGACYSLNYLFDEIGDCLPDEIADDAMALMRAAQSFQKAVEEYVIAHKDTYIDEEEE